MAPYVYATRKRAMRAADVKSSAYQGPDIDTALAAASRSVDDLCRLGDDLRPAFMPWTGAISFDWPVPNNDDAFRLWLNQHRLYSFTALTVDGVDESANAYGWPEYGPPYTALDINEDTDAEFTYTSGRGQRSISITGTWCACVPYERVNSAWTLSGSINASATTVTLNAPADIGSIVRIGSERMAVIDQAWVTSGQTGSLTASMADQSLTVATGSAFLAGETLTLDAERVLVRDVVGNTLVVQRSVDGSALAAHTSATIYWQRSCTVERGVLGTSAASHTNGDAVLIYQPPALIEQLTIAYLQLQRSDEQSGKGSKSADTSLADLEARVKTSYGRQMRVRSV